MLVTQYPSNLYKICRGLPSFQDFFRSQGKIRQSNFLIEDRKLALEQIQEVACTQLNIKLETEV